MPRKRPKQHTSVHHRVVGQTGGRIATIGQSNGFLVATILIPLPDGPDRLKTNINTEEDDDMIVYRIYQMWRQHGG